MPISQIAENTTQIAQNTTLLEVLRDWAGIIYPILGVVGTVFIWAWKRMQRSIDNMEVALTDHAKSNEELFDDLFTNQRESDKILNTLAGEHKALVCINGGKSNG